MVLLRTILLILAAATGTSLAAMQPDQTGSTSLPPGHQHGLDMELIDAEALPPEPELAADLLEFQEESWSGSPVDLLRPIHPFYRDLRRQLVRYQLAWSGLPQVRIPLDGPPLGPGATDPRVIILRERLGLPRDGGYDEALRSKLIAYQQAHGLGNDGIAGADTLRSLNRGAAYHERLFLLNMERARRLPAANPAGKYILVDAGSARLWMYEDGRAVDSMRVVVGAAASETPMMAAMIRYASVNPYWNIPPELVRSLIAPRVISEGRSYLVARGYEVLDSWEENARVVDPDTVDWRAVADGSTELRVRQLPGPGNSMGEIKFMMPNEHGIYLHDTPNRTLFGQDDRWVSNGCVRLEDARRLARWIFGEMPTPEDPSRETRVDLETPVPVYITYLTVSPDSESVVFRSDPYQRDRALLARFDEQGDGMADFPAEALARAVAERRAAAAPTRSPAAAPPRSVTRTAATPAPRRDTARPSAAPAPRQASARAAATPPTRQAAARPNAASAPRQAPARTAATSAPRQRTARTDTTPTPRQRPARTAAASAPSPRTARTPATPAPRAVAARTRATPAPRQGTARASATPAPRQVASRPAAAPPARSRAQRTTSAGPGGSASSPRLLEPATTRRRSKAPAPPARR